MADSHCPNNRWSWVEINQAALRNNTRKFKNLLAPRVKMMCVVKADAYGHGATRCARIMQTSGADQFAVATVDEGIELRKSGIAKPILILSEPPITSIDALLEYDLMPSVYTMEFALALGEAAAQLDKIAEFHLAVDTGMTRIGVEWEDVVDFCSSINFHRGLKQAGMFTHFATADSIDNWDWALQFNHFKQAVDSLRDENLPTGLVHCNNTPATMLHPEAQMDMCRVGIGLYGLYPSPTTKHIVDLEPVMSVKARVTRVIYPGVGDGVGYGMTYRVPKSNVQIATFPIGYADGLTRCLSNRMEVLCNGQRLKQVGRICMDQTMFAVDVNTTRLTPVYPVSYGDTVVVMGEDGEQRITADDLAALRDTINYEVTCDFGLRLEKVYV